MKTALISSLALGVISFHAGAQSLNPIVIGTFEQQRVAISAQSQSSRLGNAALLRIHLFNEVEEFGSSSMLLVACDGTWLSTTFKDVIQVGKPMTAAQQEEDARQREGKLDSNPIEIGTARSSSVALANQIVKRSTQICKTAGREPRNTFIPIAQSAIEDSKFTTTFFVSGTTSQVAGAIDIWIRNEEYRRTVWKDDAGKPMVFKGVEQMITESTGNYYMNRTTFDCKQRRFGVFETIEYQAGKGNPESNSIPREKARMTSVVPGTVGETQLELICSIYFSGK